MLKHNFGQTVKLQSDLVIVNIRSRSLKYINSFLSSNNVSIQVWCKKNPYWFRRQSSKKAEFTVFKDDDLDVI